MMAESKAKDNLWLPDDLHLAYDFLLEEAATAAAAENRKRVIEQMNDNEEVIAALTRRLTMSSPHKENVVMATSPQSTLYGLGRSSSFSSSNCSPDGLSTPFEQQSEDALDLLYAAAGRVVRLGLAENRSSRKPDSRHLKPTPDHVLLQQQLQADEMRHQLLKQEIAAAAWRGSRRSTRFQSGGAGRRMELSAAAAWPALQKAHQHLTVPGSGMRAAFNNGPGARRGSSGTGVFLPRHDAGTARDPPKKPTCSNVLLPARVAQSLQLDLDEVGVRPRATNTYFEQDIYGARSNKIQQQPQLRSSIGFSNKPAAVSSSSHAHQLPQEWTY